MRRIALAILILAGSSCAGIAGQIHANQASQPLTAEKIHFQSDKQDLKLHFLAKTPTRDRPAMSTPQDATKMAYGCQPGYYICNTRNGDICCPNGSGCSVEGYCY